MKKAITLFLITFGLVSINAQNCENFNQYETSDIETNYLASSSYLLLENWGTVCGSLQFTNLGGDGPNNMYLRTANLGCPGLNNWIFNSTDFNGNWVQFNGAGNQFCFDFKLFAGSGGSTYAPLRIYNGINPVQSTLRARFELNSLINVADGWQTICTPIGPEDTNGNLPSNVYGTWVMEVGTDWDTLIQDVKGIGHLLDIGISPEESYGFDNICFAPDEEPECNDEPYIQPYRDHPSFPEVACGRRDFPIQVLDSNGTPIVATGGITILWDNLDTPYNENLGGDWVFINSSNSWEATITYPNGCKYTATFQCGECTGSAPTNLYCVYSDMERQLYWDAVSGAESYELQIEPNHPSCCSDGPHISLNPIRLTTNKYTLPLGFEYDCFAYRVKAICYNGRESRFSDYQCYNSETYCRLMERKSIEVRIYPNPSDGVLNFKLISPVEDDRIFIIQVYRNDGLLLKTFKNKQTKNGEFNLRWDAKNTLDKGIYFFKFISNDEQIVKRVIIK